LPKLEKQGTQRVQGAKGCRKLLDLSSFRRPINHFQTAQKLVVNCLIVYNKSIASSDNYLQTQHNVFLLNIGQPVTVCNV